MKIEWLWFNFWAIFVRRVGNHSSFSQTTRKCQLWHFHLYFVKIKINSGIKLVTHSTNRTLGPKIPNPACSPYPNWALATWEIFKRSVHAPL